MYHMIVEQTGAYRKRMRYDPEKGAFYASDADAIAFARHFAQPYGWIKESGTPPQPHWDAILMTDAQYDLGDEIAVRVIGVFLRRDGDHKIIVVEDERPIDDFSMLTEREKADLRRLYPRVDAGEGWFGRRAAEEAMRGEKPL